MFADEYLRIYIYIVYEKQNIVDKSKYILLCYFDIAPKTINMHMQCESTVHIYIYHPDLHPPRSAPENVAFIVVVAGGLYALSINSNYACTLHKHKGSFRASPFVVSG